MRCGHNRTLIHCTSNYKLQMAVFLPSILPLVEIHLVVCGATKQSSWILSRIFFFFFFFFFYFYSAKIVF